jgi:hypothetical protein
MELGFWREKTSLYGLKNYLCSKFPNATTPLQESELGLVSQLFTMCDSNKIGTVQIQFFFNHPQFDSIIV